MAEQIPKWYLPNVPAFFVKLDGKLLPAALTLWGIICERARRGEPLYLEKKALIAVIRRETGCSPASAYRAVSGLMEKRLLEPALAPKASSPPGVPGREGGEGAALAPKADIAAGGARSDPAAVRLVLRPGEALRPFVFSILRILKIEKHTGGGGIYTLPSVSDSVLTPDALKLAALPGGQEKPPPPERGGYGGSCRDENFLKFEKVLKTEAHPALIALAREIGITRRSGLVALSEMAEAGFGPRRLWTWWRSVEAGGGGVGAFVKALAAGEVEMAPQVPHRYIGPEFCPVCGARLAPGFLEPPEECLSCGAKLGVCECRELAPAEGPCPWCGAVPRDPGEGIPQIPEGTK